MAETNNVSEFWKCYAIGEKKLHKLILINWFYLYKILEKAKL